MKDLTFYVDKFVFTEQTQDLDLSFILPNIRRRLSLEEKHTLYSIHNCISDDTRNIVFASQYGSFDRLEKIIKQYSEYNEVSPTLFSSSVHNASVGQYTILTQNTIPTLAISAGANSFEEGLITAVSLNDTLVYCFMDFFEQIKTICLLISKYKTSNQYIIRKNQNILKSANSKEIINLFLSETNSVIINNCTIERINND